MIQRLSNIALVVRDYDEAIVFYRDVLGFELLEDTYQPEQDKRWVVVRPQAAERPLSSWHAPRRPNRQPSSAIRREDASFSSSPPTISAATIRSIATAA